MSFVTIESRDCTYIVVLEVTRSVYLAGKIVPIEGIDANGHMHTIPPNVAKDYTYVESNDNGQVA